MLPLTGVVTVAAESGGAPHRQAAASRPRRVPRRPVLIIDCSPSNAACDGRTDPSPGGLSARLLFAVCKPAGCPANPPLAPHRKSSFFPADTWRLLAVSLARIRESARGRSRRALNLALTAMPAVCKLGLPARRGCVRLGRQAGRQFEERPPAVIRRSPACVVTTSINSGG